MSMNPIQPNNNPPSYGPSPEQMPVQPPFQPPVEPPVKKKKTGLIIGLIVGVVVLIAAALLILIPVAKEQARIRVYNQGATYLENGDYESAYEIFSSLGDYEDAPQIAEYAQKGIKYTAAKKNMAGEKYEKAKEVFDSLGGFKDSDDLSRECERAIAYEEGLALLESGQYEEAIKALEQSENYENADDLIKEARQKSAFETAQALFDSGDYEAALEALKDAKGDDASALLEEKCHILLAQEEIAGAIEAEEYETALDLLDSEYGQKIENREELVSECENGLRYIEGDAAYREELYYTAYMIFEELGDYRDSQSRMTSCIQSKPTTSELYHHPSYTGSTTLKIDPNSNDGSCTYFKIYSVSSDGTQTLISCVFIRSGETATVSLPGGTYVLKTAYGYGDWFGEKEMFGKEGSYSRLTASSDTDEFVLDSNTDYILTLQHAENGNVGSNSESMDTF